jgi:hypothetical protein
MSAQAECLGCHDLRLSEGDFEGVSTGAHPRLGQNNRPMLAGDAALFFFRSKLSYFGA